MGKPHPFVNAYSAALVLTSFRAPGTVDRSPRNRENYFSRLFLALNRGFAWVPRLGLPVHPYPFDFVPQTFALAHLLCLRATAPSHP